MRSLLTLFTLAALSTAQAELTPLHWPEPTTTHRPGAYWWWMGSAVDKENITWNLETMREAGIPTYTGTPIPDDDIDSKRMLPALPPP